MFETLPTAHPDEPPPAAPSLARVSAALDEVVDLQRQVDALEARRLVAVEHARVEALRAEAALLAHDDVTLSRAGAERRHDLARRAFTADLATALRLTEQAASHLLDTARTLAVGPAEAGHGTLDALRRGRLTLAHATAIADTLASLPEPEARARVEDAVLPCATSCTVPQLRRRLRRARDLAHPEPFAERHRRAAESRAVYVDPGADGMAWLTAFLPAHVAHAAYDRLTRAGRRAQEAGDVRTLAQLRSDALGGLLLAGVDGPPDARDAGGRRPAGSRAAGVSGGSADTGSPHRSGGGTEADAGSADGPRGTLTGTGTRQSTSKSRGADVPADDGRPAPEVPDLTGMARRIVPTVRVTVPVLSLLGGSDAPADLDGHGPVDAETASTLTAAAPSLRRLLVDPVDGRVLTTDPGTYTVPAALRTFLQQRDGVCRFPGCTRAAARCDVDHVVAWSDGGRTTADNLAHLCRHHHVVKHQTAWRNRLEPDGTVTWTSPTGRTHRAPPADPTGPGARAPSAPDPTTPGPTASDLAVPDPAVPEGPAPGPLALGRPAPERPETGPPDADVPDH